MRIIASGVLRWANRGICSVAEGIGGGYLVNVRKGGCTGEGIRSTGARDRAAISRFPATVCAD
jgi:hypothetical protein